MNEICDTFVKAGEQLINKQVVLYPKTWKYIFMGSEVFSSLLQSSSP